MERYASLAPYGQHRGPARLDAAATSTEVRGLPAEDRRPPAAVEAQPAAQQNPPTSPASASRYRLSQRGGEYVLTTRRQSEPLPTDEDDQVGAYASLDDARAAIPAEMDFFVFENSQTGAVEMRMGRDLAHGLTLDDDFDQVRVFASQSDAEAYANRKSS